MKKIWIIICFLCSTLTLFAGREFKIDSKTVEIYNRITEFKIREAKILLRNEAGKNGNNAILFLLQNYIDFIQLSFHDDPAFYEKVKEVKSKRFEYVRVSDKSSPYYELSLGIMHVQWAVLHFKYGEKFKAGIEFRKAYALFRSNTKKFPRLKYNYLYLGVCRAICGTIPEGYQWLSKLIGLSGNITQGMNELNKGADLKSPMFRNEARFYQIALTYYLQNNTEQTHYLFKKYNPDIRNNYLNTFLAASIYLNQRRTEDAIRVLTQRNNHSGYLKVDIFDYYLGYAYLSRLELDPAIRYLKLFEKSKGYFYQKDNAMRLSLCYYLKGDDQNAYFYKNKIKDLSASDLDADRRALKFSGENTFNHPELIKAQLLFDGGQPKRALDILKNDLEELTPSQYLEKKYRMARALDELQEKEQAIRLYTECLELPNPGQDYYPARSALQLGLIFEERGQKQNALRYYRKVLNLQGHEFKNSLDQKAKLGIARITKT